MPVSAHVFQLLQVLLRAAVHIVSERLSFVMMLLASKAMPYSLLPAATALVVASAHFTLPRDVGRAVKTPLCTAPSALLAPHDHHS